MTVGDGLAALAFWAFIGAIVLGGIWYSIRSRTLQHETLRRLAESGQPLDPALRDRLLATGNDEGKRLARALKIAGIIVLSVAPGLVLTGWLLSGLAAWTLPALAGAALLCGGVGAGLLIAAGQVTKD